MRRDISNQRRMGPEHGAILYVSCKATPMINLRADDITATEAAEVAIS